MNGTELLAEVAHRIKKWKGTQTVTDAALAQFLGVTNPAVAGYRGRELTPRQIVNLMESYARTAEKRLMEETVVPIVEFLHLIRAESRGGKKWELFSVKDSSGESHPYLEGLRKRLESSHGIYVFHDSRGRAIYAGKARRRSLWAEMNDAFNRDRGEIQNIKRVAHPVNRIEYKGLDEKRRQIARKAVSLHHLASYMSAYQIPDGLIGKFEALIVRSFANDLLNVRMENF